MSCQYKHLGFVESTATDAFATAESTYSNAKGKALSVTPAFVETFITVVEKVCAPVLEFSQHRALDVLLLADNTVCSSCCLLQSPELGAIA